MAKRDGTEQADLLALRACRSTAERSIARDDAVADQQDVGILGVVEFPARLQVAGARDVFRFQLALVSFEIIGLEEDGTDQVLARLRRSLHGPGLFRRHDLAIFEIQRLHHLADEAVGQNDGRIAIFVGEFEGQHGEVGHLLHGSGSQHEVAVVAVASAFHHGEVVALFGGDVAEARTSAHHVDDDAGQFGARKIGDAFLHQADSGTGGGGHDARSSRSRAVHHVDGGDFAFRLQKRAARLAGI